MLAAVFVIVIGVGVFTYVLGRYVLLPIFREYSKTAELNVQATSNVATAMGHISTSQSAVSSAALEQRKTAELQLKIGSMLDRHMTKLEKTVEDVANARCCANGPESGTEI